MNAFIVAQLIPLHSDLQPQRTNIRIGTLGSPDFTQFGVLFASLWGHHHAMMPDFAGFHVHTDQRIAK
jgi:hypothetical protein